MIAGDSNDSQINMLSAMRRPHATRAGRNLFYIVEAFY